MLIVNKECTKDDIEADINRIGRSSESLTNRQAQLEDSYYSNRIENNGYERLHLRYRIEAEGYKQQTDELLAANAPAA
ncbi:hypothetical protein ACFLW3_02460 [Chloroflexota bacterium]